MHILAADELFQSTRTVQTPRRKLKLAAHYRLSSSSVQRSNADFQVIQT